MGRGSIPLAGHGRCTPGHTMLGAISRTHGLAALLILAHCTTSCQLAGALAVLPAGNRPGSGGLATSGDKSGREGSSAQLFKGREVPRTHVPGTAGPGTEVAHTEVPDAKLPDTEVSGTGELVRGAGLKKESTDEPFEDTEVPDTEVPGTRLTGRRDRRSWGPVQRFSTSYRHRKQEHKGGEHRLRGRALQEFEALPPPYQSSLTGPIPAPSGSTAESPSSAEGSDTPTSAGSSTLAEPPTAPLSSSEEAGTPTLAGDSDLAGHPSGFPGLPQAPEASGSTSGGASAPDAGEAALGGNQAPGIPDFPAPLVPAPDAPALESSALESPASKAPSPEFPTADPPPSNSAVSDAASGGATSAEAQDAGAPPAQPGEWRPQAGKFLLAICLFGRMSNQLSCMRSYFRAALLTNRALLVPTWGVAINVNRIVDYTFPWDVPVDWGRMARCLEPAYGSHTVMTVKQYLTLYGKTKVNVTNFRGLQRSRDWAWWAGGGGVAENFRRLNSEELEIPGWESVPETGWLQHISGKPSPADVAALGASIQDDVISFGELFTAELDSRLPPLHIPDSSCSNLWRPHPGIMEFVAGVQRWKIGGTYAAMHFRRGDFYKYRKPAAMRTTEEQFPSVTGAATKVRAWLQKRNVTRLFVATNARPLELRLFKAVASEPVEGFQVEAVVSLRDILSDPEWLKQQAWAQPALALDQMGGIGGLVWSIVDKYVCVYADMFWGSPGSTFSGEIDWTLRRYEFQGYIKQR